MKRFLILIVLLGPPLLAQPQDAATQLRTAFDNYGTFGVSVFAKTLYAEEPVSLKAAEDALVAQSKGLGAMHGGDVLLSVDFSPRFRRIYAVLYFERKPLWFRVDYYTVNGRSFFLPLFSSPKPEEVLPDSITGYTH